MEIDPLPSIETKEIPGVEPLPPESPKYSSQKVTIVKSDDPNFAEILGSQAIRVGIIPYVYRGETFRMVLGVKPNGRLTDFGGTCERKETILDCGLREFNEETSGTLVPPKPEQLTIFIINVSKEDLPPYPTYQESPNLPWITMMYNYTADLQISTFIPNTEIGEIGWYDVGEVYARKYGISIGLYNFLKEVHRDMLFKNLVQSAQSTVLVPPTTPLTSLTKGTAMMVKSDNPTFAYILKNSAHQIGIIPYAKRDGVLQLLLGTDYSHHLVDLGGGCSSRKSVYDCALSNLNKRTNGMMVVPKLDKLTILAIGTWKLPLITLLYDYTSSYEDFSLKFKPNKLLSSLNWYTVDDVYVGKAIGILGNLLHNISKKELLQLLNS